eukprot:gene9539-10543_t
MFKLNAFLLALVALLASCTAFVAKTGAARTMLKASAMQLNMQMPKAIAAMAPAFIAAPAFAADAMHVGIQEVSFGAYLAVLLGTFVPVTFLIILYSQSEARKNALNK